MNQSTTSRATQVDSENAADRITESQIECRALLVGLRSAANDRRLADLVAELQRGELAQAVPDYGSRLDAKSKLESEAVDLAELVTARVPLPLPLGRHHVPELDALTKPPEATG